MENKDQDSILKNAVKPAYFILDTVKADVLFRNMKKERQYIAVVLDEYGGMNGIITINDLVERLVGDLGEDDGEEVLPVQKTEEGTWKVLGSALLEEVSEEIGLHLPTEEYETFSGYILHQMEKIPEDGSVIRTKIGQLEIISAVIKEHQVEHAIIKVNRTEE